MHVQKACVAAGVEHGKRIVWEQVTTAKSEPKAEENVAARTKEMEDAFVSFTEIDFAIHLLLGSLDMLGLPNLCQEAQGKGSEPSPSFAPGNT